ncbi:hypothetical protein [Cytobacillus praedii]|nr:hypothetical protein [Cytobacillus praedii]
MTVYDVIDHVFDADERLKDNRLAKILTVEWATKIQVEQKY